MYLIVSILLRAPRALVEAASARQARVLPALALLALVPACQRKNTAEDVIAKVNGHKLQRVEMEKYYRNQTAGAPQQPAQEQAASLRLSILRELIDQEILTQRAERLGLLANDEEVESKLNEMKSPYTQEEFNKRLSERKITADDLKRDLRRTITVDKVMNKEINSKVTISDADVTSYYTAHKPEFNLIEPQYHLAHIWVTPQPNPQVHNLRSDKAQNDAEARKKIQTILNRLESGEDFANVAMNYSEDPESSTNGGDLGFTPESGLQSTDPATRDAVRKLKPGQFSGVITLNRPGSPRGYRIVKLLAREPAGQRDLSDPRVQQAIREQLRERREQLLKAAYFEVLRNQAKVENYYADEVLKNSGQK